MNARKVKLVKSDESACPKCGNHVVTARTFADTVDFRSLELDVEGLRDSKCGACGYVWTSKEQDSHNNNKIRTAYAIERDRLREAHGLLSGAEIAQVRNELGLNQRVAASLFGGGINAFNKYESGEVLQSLAMDRLLRIAKLIGKPVLTFLQNVNAPIRFVAVASDFSSASTSNFVLGVPNRTRMEGLTWCNTSSQPVNANMIFLLVHQKNQHIAYERTL